MLSASTAAYVLLAVGLTVYVLGLLFGSLSADRTHRSPTWTRMVNSAALVLAALVWWLGVAKGGHLASFAGFIFGGMLCSFVGDLLMAQVLPMPMYPVPGMLAFGAAHVLYIFGYARAGTALGLGDGRAWAGAVIGGLVLAAVLWWALIRAPGEDPVLGYGALGYALLLGGMAGAAAALALQDPRFSLLALGALLFLISDAILGNRLFRHNNWLLVGDVVWILYIAGQSFIVLTSAVVLSV